LFCFTDLNECLEVGSGSGSGDLSVCGPNQTCVNTFGSFVCLCRPGFTGVGQECVGRSELCLRITTGLSITVCLCVSSLDLDECAQGTSQCSQICLNTPGSFTCGCQPGFQLDFDGRGCI